MMHGESKYMCMYETYVSYGDTLLCFRLWDPKSKQRHVPCTGTSLRIRKTSRHVVRSDYSVSGIVLLFGLTTVPHDRA